MYKLGFRNVGCLVVLGVAGFAGACSSEGSDELDDTGGMTATSGGMATGGLGSGGAATGGIATGGTPSGGVSTGGRPATGGVPATGGIPATGAIARTGPGRTL